MALLKTEDVHQNMKHTPILKNPAQRWMPIIHNLNRVLYPPHNSASVFQLDCCQLYTLLDDQVLTLSI